MIKRFQTAIPYI